MYELPGPLGGQGRLIYFSIYCITEDHSTIPEAVNATIVRDFRARTGFWLAHRANAGYKIFYPSPIPYGQVVQTC